MGFDGNLQETSAIEAFHEVLIGRKTGHLTFQAAAAQARFHFLFGAVTGAEGPSFQQALHKVLARSGKIDEEKVAEIAAKHARPDDFDTELVKLDVFTRKELKEQRTQAVKEALWATFGVREGSYAFEDERPGREGAAPDLNLATADLLLQGIRQEEDYSIVERDMSKRMDGKLKAPQFQLIEAQMRSLRPEEGFILSRIDGTVTVEQVCSLSSLPTEQTLRVLYALISSGLLEFDEPVVPLEMKARAAAHLPDKQQQDGDFEVDLEGVGLVEDDAAKPRDASRPPPRPAEKPAPGRASGAVPRPARRPDASFLDAAAEQEETPIDDLSAKERKAKAREALESGRKLAEKELWQKAVPLLKESVSLHEREPEAWMLLGTCLARSPGSRKEAEEALMKAIDLNHKHSDYYMELGRLYKEMGNLPKARLQFENALHWDPSHEEAKAELKGEGMAAFKEGMMGALDGVKGVFKDVFKGRKK